jgi:hypothetical protein
MIARCLDSRTHSRPTEANPCTTKKKHNLGPNH